MSWLSKATGVHWNLRPLAAPVGGIVGGLIGGPLGAGIGAGLFKSGDNLAHGDNIGHALGQGALNGALAYGTAGMFGGGGGAGSAGGQVAADTEPGLGSAIPNSAYGMSDTGQNVMRRVLGSAGSFIKDNRGTLETVGQGAQGVMNAVGQNKQLGIEASRAAAENAQIQAAIDKQKAIAAAFAQMYGRPLPTQGTPTLPGSPVHNQVMSRVTGFAPGGASRVVVDGGERGRTGDPYDPNNPTQPTQGGNPPPKQPVPPNPMGALGAIPSSPYAGNDSLYGSPYGYGYSNIGRYVGGY